MTAPVLPHVGFGPGAELTALDTGIYGDLTVLEAGDLARVLSHIGGLWSATEWVLGDLVVELLRRARDGEPLPEEVWADLHQATAARAAKVALAFPRARRRPALTWSHHELVAAMPERHQDRLLDVAEAEVLSVRALRAVIVQEAEDARPQLGGMPPAKWQPPVRLAKRVGQVVAEHPEAAAEIEAAIDNVIRRWK